MADKSEIEIDIHPDADRLDEEWVRQPRLRFRLGAELADARRELLQGKADLEVMEAELEMAIRNSPETYGLAKVTEAAIKATVLLQPVWQKAKRAVIERQHEVDVLDAAVSACDQKKSALERLVQLRLAEYYGEPRAPEGARERMEEVGKQAVRSKGRRRPEPEDDWQ